MPKGAQGQKRPADAIGRAIMVAKLATGEIEETTTEDGKDPNTKALARLIHGDDAALGIVGC